MGLYELKRFWEFICFENREDEAENIEEKRMENMEEEAKNSPKSCQPTAGVVTGEIRWYIDVARERSTSERPAAIIPKKNEERELLLWKRGRWWV